jgi:hypothetical protein
MRCDVLSLGGTELQVKSQCKRPYFSLSAIPLNARGLILRAEPRRACEKSSDITTVNSERERHLALYFLLALADEGVAPANGPHPVRPTLAFAED